MSTSIITSRAVSLPNPHGYAPGLPFDFVVTYPAGYDLANAWQKISFSATSDGDPLFTITEDSSEISVSGQVLSINIDPATANEIVDGDDFATVWGASHQLFFAVEVGPSSTPTVGDYRIQGKAERLPKRGPFAETGRNAPYTLTLGTDAITVSVAGQGAKGDDGDPGPGLPAGGTVGQIPTKASGDDYDVEWTNAGAGDLVAANNLSDLADAATARTNLGLGTAATSDTGDFATAGQGTLADTAIQPADISGLTGGATGQIATKSSGDDYDLTWSDDLTVPGLLTADHIHGNIAGTLYIHVKNTSGGTLAKGTPVYVTGHVGSSDRVEVAAADQSDPAKMPAIALLAQELANNGEGDGVIVGEIRTFDTDTPGYALNDELFVGTGALTATKPTTGAVQPVATVGRLQASTGVLVINCQGQRSPDETFAPALGADDNYVTDAEKVVIGNTSGTNTGDQDLSGLMVKSANLSDLTNAATARTNLGVDEAGTDNSTDVTLAGALDYLTISGQTITRNAIDLSTDVTGTLPVGNGGTGVTALASLDAASLGAGASTDGQVLTSDGAGGAAWEDAAGGGGGGASNIWIPASAWIPKTTGGCGVDSRETTTHDQNFDELLFDAAADELADALVVMPNNYNNGTITARFYWTAASGSGGVAWAIQGRAFANDDALDTAAGTAQLVTDTLIAADDMHVTSATSAVTIGGTPAANTPIQFTIHRDVSDAGDDLGVDARLLGVEILYTLAS